MRELVIFDNTGKIYSVQYGVDTAPQGIRSVFVDIQEEAQLDRIDVTNPSL